MSCGMCCACASAFAVAPRPQGEEDARWTAHDVVVYRAASSRTGVALPRGSGAQETDRHRKTAPVLAYCSGKAQGRHKGGDEDGSGRETSRWRDTRLILSNNAQEAGTTIGSHLSRRGKPTRVRIEVVRRLQPHLCVSELLGAWS